jgi:hypothetical protein
MISTQKQLTNEKNDHDAISIKKKTLTNENRHNIIDIDQTIIPILLVTQA